MSFFVVPIAGYLSDRTGRKRMYLMGSVVTGVFGFIYFALLNRFKCKNLFHLIA
jgi:MFS family permease